MRDEELQKWTRQELLEYLVQVMNQNQKLEQEVQQLQKQLEDKTIQIQNAGSLAEASLQMNHLFEDADKAVLQYLQNAKHMAEETDRQCKEKEERTNRIIAANIQKTKDWMKQAVEETQRQCAALRQDAANNQQQSNEQ